MKILLCVFLLFFYTSCLAQTNKEKAQALSEEAWWFIDNNNYQEALKLLKEACEADPGNIHHPIDVSFAYYKSKDYHAAIQEAEKLLGRTDATDKVIQIIANSYRQLDKDIKAKAVLDRGIKKFPASPRLHMELGLLQLYWKQFDNCLISFENGIKADPRYPYNYYWAAMVCLKAEQQEKMWGMLYGEMFLLMAKDEDLTDEMSKLLYDTYKSQIVISANKACYANFALPPDPDKTATWHKNNPPKPTYCTSIYEPTLANAAASEKSITLASLVRIRTGFLDFYYMQQFDKKHQNRLLDYQKKVADAGHQYAYHYWLLSSGDKAAFKEWRERNADIWQAFETWFEVNPFEPLWNSMLVRSKDNPNLLHTKN